MQSIKAIKRDLKDNNCSQIPFKLSKKELNAAAESFLEFLTIPREAKEKFYLLRVPEDRGSAIGYVRKSTEQGDLDEKEYFHYNEFVESEFNDLLSNTKDEKTLNFLENARKVYEASKNATINVLDCLEKDFPGIKEKFLQDGKTPNFYLRFLKYNKLRQGTFLAKGHYDRGMMTLAIAESSPGLRIGFNPEKLKPIKHEERKAIFMPAIKVQEITSKEFKPAWHDVVQLPEHGVSESTARWAIVFFVDTLSVNYATFEEAHTPREY